MTQKSDASPRVDNALEWVRHKPLRAVWGELRRRLGASEGPVASFTVDLDSNERAALTALLGRDRLVAPRTRISVGQLASALGVERDELSTLVAAIAGPIDNRAQARRAALEARAALWANAEELLGRVAPLTLARIRATGVPDGDTEAYGEMLSCLAQILARLPLASPTPLPVLAWEATGDPHVLDVGTIRGRWLASALVERAGGDIGSLRGTIVRRAALDVGILLDRLSTPTLTWGLRAAPCTPAGRCLEGAASDEIPVHLSSALLDRGAPVLREPAILCVENPSLIEWLHLTGQRIPTVCTSGWPSLDAQRFVQDLRQQGLRVFYAGDYDIAGLKIATLMRERFDVSVLMSEDDYLSAAPGARLALGDGVPETAWCPPLRAIMQDLREARYQEDPEIRRRLVARFEDAFRM